MITTPTSISNCVVWLDASDRTTLFQLSGGTTAVAANNDPVGYWGDKSGNNRHFLNNAGTTASRPTWVSSLSTVRFDGVNDYLSSFFNLTYTAQTVFVVVANNVGSSGIVFTQVSSGGSDSAAAGHYRPISQTNTPLLYASYASGGFRSNITYTSLSAVNIVTTTHSGSVLRNFLNGVSSSEFSHTLNYAVALSRLGAAATTAGNNFNGDISEVIVYNRALTNAEREDVEYYLSRKWSFLNTIPRQVYALKNGNWSDSTIWSVSADPAPWNFPLSADNVYTNTFTVTADSSTKVDTIRNSTLAPNILSGGSFVLANGVSLSANVVGGVAPYTLTLLPAASAEVYGNVSQGATIAINLINPSNLTVRGNVTSLGQTVNTINVTSIDSTLNVLGNVFGGGNIGHTIDNTTSSTVNIVGDVTAGGSAGYAIRNNSSGTVNLTGTVVGASGSVSAMHNNSNGNINIVGNVLGGTASTNSTITNNGTGFTSLSGNIISRTASGSTVTGNSVVIGNVYSSNAASALASTSTTTPLSVYGNIINAPNGRQAIYAPRYQVFPTGSAQYTRQAVNGYDSYVDYWTSNSTFSYPASSDVALGTSYSNSTLSGSMAVPSPSSVALGAPVGTTVGTASITFDSVLNQPIANLNTPNSIGARLKNITTSQALSAIVDSLEF